MMVEEDRQTQAIAVDLGDAVDGLVKDVRMVRRVSAG